MSDTIRSQKRRQQANEINTLLMASGSNAMSADMSMEEWFPWWMWIQTKRRGFLETYSMNTNDYVLLMLARHNA